MNKNEIENALNIKTEDSIKEKEIKEIELETFDVFHEIEIAHAKYGLDNTFISFLYYNIPYIVFATKDKSIISYNLDNLSITAEIKSAHDEFITNFRDYRKNNNIIYILSISATNNNIKIWNFKNWECIFDLKLNFLIGSIFSSCYLLKDNKDYIIASSTNDSQYIRLYDFTGKELISFNDSKGKLTCLDYYLDSQTNKYYIIAGYSGYAKSFDLENNKLYHKYEDIFADTFWHGSLKINSTENIIKLIDSCWLDDLIRIWDFHKGKLISKFKTGGDSVKCICLWEEVSGSRIASTFWTAVCRSFW